MDIFAVFTLFGGLALFLYGMELMGDGLKGLSGGRMEKLLAKLTSSRLKGVLLGLGVTAVIQSSSATTVMVVGFVNSGIMKLQQAVGVIMGANIGTTVTSWLLSLSGIQSSNIWLRLLKPSAFSPVLAAVGICFLMFTKSEKKKQIGNIMLGFAILMFGMETMSGAVEPLADMPGFRRVFTMFSNPILGMLVGALLTAVIQSSSASVGILQALCATGAVSFGTAIPIIMGQNIGTCVTALISSIGASKNARRAAMIHLYFNLIGTTVFMVVFYSMNAFFHFGFLSVAAAPAGVATVHSLFNIGATLLLFPFGNGLVKLAAVTIPDRPDEETQKAEADFARLDERFLGQPAVAIEQSRIVIGNMADRAREAMDTAMSLLYHYDETKAQRAATLENRIDHYEDALGSYLVKISAHALSEKDSQLVSVYLHSIGDFERISDHAVSLMHAYREMEEKKIFFSEEAVAELAVFQKAVSDILELACESFKNMDRQEAEKVEPLEQVIDKISLEEKQRHIVRLRQGRCTIELGFILQDIITDLERVSDHCSNIAGSLLQIDEGGYDVHEFMNVFRGEENKSFMREFDAMDQLYQLPPSPGQILDQAPAPEEEKERARA